jgi:N-acetyl-anhydromuramoyl-L-alanine amidase
MMTIDETKNLLNGAEYLPSPHCDARPMDMVIDMVVIHGISLPPGEFGTGAIQKFFGGELDYSLHPYFESISTLKVSSHLLIERTGKITQFVPFHQRAWHAGKSSFKGRENCNDFSIGIELEGTDEMPYEKIQYEKLADIIRAIRKIYPAVTRERIVGHETIAPGRKTDPGPSFDWGLLNGLLDVGG